MNANNTKGKYLDAGIAQITYKDKIWGVPVENTSIAVVFYNKAQFAKYGLSEPKTLAELEKVADTFLANGVKPFALANQSKWTGDMYYQFFATRYGGTKPFQDALKGTGTYEAQNFVQAGQLIQDWVKKGYFNDGFNGMSPDTGVARQLLYRGEAAMYINGTWDISNFKSENPEWYNNMGIFNFPAIEGAAGDPNTVLGTVGDNFYHVSAKCAYPEAAFQLTQYLLDDIAVKERIGIGRVPPLKGLAMPTPILQQVVDTLGKAPDLQFWYDQSLNPQVTDAHLNGSQELFGLTITPEAAAKQWSDAQKEYLSGL
jgi:raffinose/stachyose/melibiose transport system substrate-binding protein